MMMTFSACSSKDPSLISSLGSDLSEVVAINEDNLDAISDYNDDFEGREDHESGDSVRVFDILSEKFKELGGWQQ